MKNASGEVLFPFSFISSYFEITGKLQVDRKSGRERFNWYHSYAKIFYPKEKYSSSGPYLWFENFDVENRERVKYISAIHGVPVTSQWDAKGHLYPVQVCQYALSSFSKNATLPPPKRWSIFKDGRVNKDYAKLQTFNSAILTTIEDTSVMSIESRASFIITPDQARGLVMQIHFKPLASFNMTIILENISNHKQFKLNYASISQNYTINGNSFTYGYGLHKDWLTLTRNLATDLSKSKIILGSKSKTKLDLRVSKIQLKGKALLKSLRLSSNEYEDNFIRASQFLLQTQDSEGGWPVSVTRKLANGDLILKPGWYSAMAQGQAISVLTRMYRWSGQVKYLKAASRAIDLFYRTSSEGGVRAHFMNKYPWYEEYPTTPSSFVLNGFIYSLFGLYDLMDTCDIDDCRGAKNLFHDGIQSLKAMIPLYDTGSGTLYDLRHVSLHGPPNLARWDYHTTHIDQLLFLNTIIDDLYFQTTAKRWISYTKGKRASHN